MEEMTITLVKLQMLWQKVITQPSGHEAHRGKSLTTAQFQKETKSSRLVTRSVTDSSAH